MAESAVDVENGEVELGIAKANTQGLRITFEGLSYHVGGDVACIPIIPSH